MAAVALVLTFFASSPVAAYADGPITAAIQHGHEHARWHQSTVSVFSNWDTAVCTSAYSNPTGDSTPPLSPREMQSILSTAIAQLNLGLDGRLVLVDAGTGLAGVHCGEAAPTGVISVGWSPLTPGIAGFALQASNGDAIIGSGVVISTIVPCKKTGDTVKFVMLHEMMHSLGIPHSDVPGSLMYERNGCGATASLGAADLAALDERYPAPVPVASAAPIRTDAATSSNLTQRPGATRLAVTEPDLTPPQLIAQLAAAGCDARLLAITSGGRFLMYVPGAPAFVNAAFPSSLGAGSPFIYHCGG
ncbi:MAG: matrixin family metalloprotease [Chloroflexi bacterium]|nr:matrixin family metalloprotease [Chloroflexota bacterium]